MTACAWCTKALTSTNPRARYCNSSCRANATVARKNGTAPPSVVRLAPPVSTGPGSCRAATLAELSSAGCADTAIGQAALALAARIDKNLDTGSSLATAVKQLAASLAEATKGAAAASVADQLRARRDAKRHA